MSLLFCLGSCLSKLWVDFNLKIMFFMRHILTYQVLDDESLKTFQAIWNNLILVLFAPPPLFWGGEGGVPKVQRPF